MNYTPNPFKNQIMYWITSKEFSFSSDWLQLPLVEDDDSNTNINIRNNNKKVWKIDWLSFFLFCSLESYDILCLS